MSKTMRPWVPLLAAIWCAAAAPGLEAQTLKVGVFDPQRVSEATALGKQMQEQLSAFQSKKQKEIEEKQNEITTLQRKLSQQELSLSSDTRTRMEKDIQRRLLALEAARETATRELQLELSAAKSIFEEKLFLAVETFGRDEGFQLILDRSLVAWADSALDVTSHLIDRFDKLFPVEAEKKE